MQTPLPVSHSYDEGYKDGLAGNDPANVVNASYTSGYLCGIQDRDRHLESTVESVESLSPYDEGYQEGLQGLGPLLRRANYSTYMDGYNSGRDARDRHLAPSNTDSVGEGV